MAYDTRGKRGCGCCGPVGCVSGLLLIIVLSVAAFFVVRFAWDLSDQPLPVNQNTVPPGAYPQVRHRLNDFMGNAEIRSVLLSEADINAMLEDAPELAFLGKGASIAFRENEAELRFRVPLHLFPFNTKYLNYEVFLRPIVSWGPLHLFPFNTKYLNYEVFLRPIVSWGKVTVNVSRVTSAGKPLDPITLRGFKEQVEPLLNQMLSWLNEMQQSRAIQSIRVQNGSMLLER